MLKLMFLILLAASQNGLSASAQALTQQEIAQELIGSPVYSMQGQAIGTVVDVALDEDEQFRNLSLKTSGRLGFGERTVKVPGSAFIVLRGAVVLELPMESLKELLGQGAEETVRANPWRLPR